MNNKEQKQKKTLSVSCDRPQESLGFMFWHVTNLWQRKMTQALESVDLTHVQFMLLAGIDWLEEKGICVTQTSVAKHVNADIMMTSKVVRTLEKKKLITRMNYHKDVRANLLNLTMQGDLVLVRALKIVEDVDKNFFISCDGRESAIKDLLRSFMQY